MSTDDQADLARTSTIIVESGDDKSDAAEATVDKLEDTVNSVIQPVLAVKELYETNSDAIHEATKALSTLGGTGRVVDDWVGVVDKVIGGLDDLTKSTAFPFVGAAVFLFKAVVKLETQRRQNSRRSHALILQMADMMGALLQLSSVQDPELKDQRTGQTVVGRIQALMSSIEQDIKDCGNLIDTYAKHSLPSKFFFSGQYADKFKARAESLVNRKGEITFALQIHNTIGIDTIQKEVKENNAMLAKLINIVDHPKEQNEDLNNMMRDLGGRNKVLGDDELLTTMATAILSRKDNRTEANVEDGAKFSRTEGAVLSATERHELRLPLDDALEQNAKFYSEKLDAQISRIASQIDRLQSSSDIIVKKLTGGPWERIVHPDLRDVWKENGWRANVHSQLFVMAMHDYYDDVFQSGSLDRAGGAIDLQPVATSAETAKSSAVAAQDSRRQHVTAADKWCLQYLDVRYAASLMEAFDADASGFVRVAEVNAFCDSIPEGLNLLQWLAYWAAGWKQEAAIYSHKIIGLLRRMRSMVGDALLQNNRVIQRYFQGSTWRAGLGALLYAVASKFHTSATTPLDALVESEMKRKEASREQLLNKLFYGIDEPESVGLVCVSPRLEADLLPIVYQILKHHCRLIYISRVKVLDDREFTRAASSLTQILRLVKFRVETLESTWKLLGLDCNTQFSRYAGGFFEFAYNGKGNGDPDDVFDEDFYDDVDSDIQTITSDISPIKLQFGEWGLDTSGYKTAPEENSLENTSLEPETPLSPVAYTPSVELSVPAEEFVRRVVIRLEGLGADERFRSIKPVVQILRNIALAERQRRPAQLTRRLILEVADTLSAVLKIRAVEDVSLVTDTGESILTRLQSLMLKLERDVKDCGRLINLYHSAGSGRDSAMKKKFEDRREGLERRKQDIVDALVLPSLKGKVLFRAAVHTVIAQIQDNRWRNTWSYIEQRRDNRKIYVNLVAKQLELAEIRTIWNVKTSLTPAESRQLEATARELLHGDWLYYQSLARLQHRSAWVHADRRCDSCDKLPIYGARFLCTVCNNFDLCSECEKKWERGDLDLRESKHQASHPLIKVARPVIEIDKHVFAGLKLVHKHLVTGDDSESSSGSSMEFSGDEDSAREDADGLNDKTKDATPIAQMSVPEPASALKSSPSRKPWSFSEVESLPQNEIPWNQQSDEADVETPTELPHPQWPLAAARNVDTDTQDGSSVIVNGTRRRSSAARVTSNDSLPPAAKYRCLRCKQYKVGVRFVMTREHRGKQLCPSCEAILSQRHEKGTLPDYLRLLLKCSIPPVAPRQSTATSAAAPPVTANGAGNEVADTKRIETLESQVRELKIAISRFVDAQDKHQAKKDTC